MGDPAMTHERGDPVAPASMRMRGENNALLAAARPLLELACTLRLRQFEEPLEPLRERLRTMVDAFDETLAAQPMNERGRTAARYCLCTFVDEIVASMPSGGGGAWASRSLLMSFHGETSGGERFFVLVKELSRDANTHLDVLELIYVMLALGMEGRYRLLEGGAAQLESMRADLRRLLLAERGMPPAWPGTVIGREHGWRGGGRWRWYGAAIALSLTGLVSLTVLLDARLHAQALPVIATLADVTVKPAAPAPAGPPGSGASAANGLADTLTRRLAIDLSDGRIALDASTARTVLTLGSDALFAPGSARVLPGRVTLLQRVGTALRGVDARIVVTGHTDDTAPSRGRPSNWQLSLARATEVVNLLRERAGAPERFLAQGRGASEAVVSNDTPSHRARNRRVVITLIADGAAL
ncbi:type IV secretion protein DotU [Trinickia dabaoshanensis]|uniref:Type IV secretion protein DotU n=1 Tax=Trinickia dabaoshanensis TaxID=564714 RepID=A0A2N7VTE7_9BURK|nr:type IVB secretion system protein IcmH/DotU [Trinickia dabaoshanensis]PMS20431.1 type IV secretion protein DotU [Trinickia dabaoshanensis]